MAGRSRVISNSARVGTIGHGDPFASSSGIRLVCLDEGGRCRTVSCECGDGLGGPDWGICGAGCDGCDGCVGVVRVGRGGGGYLDPAVEVSEES